MGEITDTAKDAADNAVPSGNGMMADALARLWLVTGEDRYRAAAAALVEAYAGGAAEQPWAHPWLLVAADMLERGASVVVAGMPDAPDTRALLAAAHAAPELGVTVQLADADLPPVIEGGNTGLHVKPIVLFGARLESDAGFYYLVLGLTAVCCVALANLLRSPTGRAFVAVRDSEISAACMGVNLARTKTLSFALSAALTGIGGALYAHKVSFISPEQFTLLVSIELVTIVILGGVGSLHGAVLGAAFIIVLPQAIAIAKDYLPAGVAGAAGLQSTVFGLVLIAFIVFEPMGLYGRWLKIRTWFELFPFYRKGMFRRQKAYMKSERVR